MHFHRALGHCCNHISLEGFGVFINFTLFLLILRVLVVLIKVKSDCCDAVTLGKVKERNVEESPLVT